MSPLLFLLPPNSIISFLLVFALLLLWRQRQRLQPAHWMLLLAFAGQVAATLGWLFSLETAFSRMTILFTLIGTVLSAAAAAAFWPRPAPDTR